jgi:hypothetical protein
VETDLRVTPSQELAMRERARKCPLCGVYMTSKPNRPNSKHLDHILPRNRGGTHTHGNVRIICFTCNVRRPKDGSDYTGPLSLWAQGPEPESSVGQHGRKNRDTCRKGLHSWIPANIAIGPDGRNRCAPCLKARDRKYPLRQCGCGTSFAASGRTFMCDDCTEVTARKAAALHASGLTWDQVAAEVGYGSGSGAAYAAKRAGYAPAPKPRTPERQRACPDCGMPKRPGSSTCQPCTTAKAWRAVEMRSGGMTLQMIANRMGYDSISSVTNLMKTVVHIESRIGRPSHSVMITQSQIGQNISKSPAKGQPAEPPGSKTPRPETIRGVV